MISQTFVRGGAYVTDPVLRDSTAYYAPGLSSRVGSDSTFMHSGLKNMMIQTDAAGSTSASKQYDAFGNLVGSSGTWSGPFGYAGGFGYQEDATGLKLLGHRYYDSSTGRFLTRDPIKDGRNWYVYCDSNPTTFIDPWGLLFKEIGGVAGGLVGGALVGAVVAASAPVAIPAVVVVAVGGMFVFGMTQLGKGIGGQLDGKPYVPEREELLLDAATSSLPPIGYAFKNLEHFAGVVGLLDDVVDIGGINDWIKNAIEALAEFIFLRAQND